MIFNSLGSNYNLEFVLKSLFASNDKHNKIKLTNFLNKKYNGETTLLYKGREAIKLALDLLELPKGSKVGITGFTCYAVYKAVVDTDCSLVYLDIERSTLNFSLEEIKKHKDLKVLIIQNTLGNPCDTVNIKKYCSENKIILIEDLAHSIGTTYNNGKEAGSYGDFVVLSFGQDKVVDAVSGGALIIKNDKYRNLTSKLLLRSISFRQQLKDRLYPLFTFKIRKTYQVGLGKILHSVLKKTNWLSKPVDGTSEITFHNLPNWYCSLILFQFSKLENNLKHRKEISNVYQKELRVSPGFVLRYPLLVNNRKDIIKFLKNYGVYVSDIWYDAPVAPVRFLGLTNYSGECPISEDVSSQIINLPTHINISVSEAKDLSNKINKWLNTQ